MYSIIGEESGKEENSEKNRKMRLFYFLALIIVVTFDVAMSLPAKSTSEGIFFLHHSILCVFMDFEFQLFIHIIFTNLRFNLTLKRIDMIMNMCLETLISIMHPNLPLMQNPR